MKLFTKILLSICFTLGFAAPTFAVEWLKTGLNVYQTSDGLHKLVLSEAGVLFVEMTAASDLQSFHLEQLKKSQVKNHAFIAFNGDYFSSFMTEARRYKIGEQAGFSLNLNKNVRIRINNLIPGMTLIASEGEKGDKEAILFLRGYEPVYRGGGKQAIMLIEGSAKYSEISKPYTLLANGMVYLESGGKKTAVRSGKLGILQEPPQHQCLSQSAIFLDDNGVRELLAVRKAKNSNKSKSLKKLSRLLEDAKKRTSPLRGALVLQVVDNSLILFDYSTKPEKIKFVDYLGDAADQILCSVEDFEL